MIYDDERKIGYEKGWEEGWEAGFDSGREELLKKQPHWIPVEESKPPECPCDCIVYTDKGCVMEASYLGMDSNHEWVSRYCWVRVTHWMPLPKPPQVSDQITNGREVTE